MQPFTIDERTRRRNSIDTREGILGWCRDRSPATGPLSVVRTVYTVKRCDFRREERQESLPHPERESTAPLASIRVFSSIWRSEFLTFGKYRLELDRLRFS